MYNNVCNYYMCMHIAYTYYMYTYLYNYIHTYTQYLYPIEYTPALWILSTLASVCSSCFSAVVSFLHMLSFPLKGELEYRWWGRGWNSWAVSLCKSPSMHKLLEPCSIGTSSALQEGSHPIKSKTSAEGLVHCRLREKGRN